MTAWRPQAREPDAFRAALYDYVRTRAAQVFLAPGGATQPLGRADVVMSNGRHLAIDLSLSPVDVATLNQRAALVFALEGDAAEGRAGYAVTGRVVLDRKTLAFLEIEVSATVVNLRA